MLGQAFRYVKRNLFASAIAFYALAMVIPPIPFVTTFYYAMMAVLWFYMATRPGMSPNIYMLLFYGAAVLSIIVGNPPVVFKSWGRLGLFAMVTGAAFCLFQSPKGNLTHFKILKVTLWLFVLVGVISFFCYFLGINYMRSYASEEASFNTAGAFGGITQQSMVLGPISAAGAVFLCSRIIFGKYRGRQKFISLMAMLFCFLSVLLSASRSATLTCIAGFLIVLYLRYRRNLGKFYQYVFLAVIGIACAAPLMGGFTRGLEQKQQINEEKGGTFASREDKWTNRINEFESSPIFGIGFASIDLNTAEGHAESTRKTGVIEPGASWLAILSMTGIVGAIPIGLLIISTLRGLNNKNRRQPSFTASTLYALLIVSILHQFAEGFAISAGSYLCFEFWLLLGVCTSYGQLNNRLPEL